MSTRPARPDKKRPPRWRALGLCMAIMGALSLNLVAQGFPGFPCAGLENDEIIGIGSKTQLDLHLNLYANAFEAMCPGSLGRVTYLALGDTAGTTAAAQHDRGPEPILRPYMFYTSDLPMSIDEYYTAYMDLGHPFNAALLSDINHFPLYVDGISVVYNLTGCDNSQPLRLTKQVLSDIYLGRIITWNNPQITANNPHLSGCVLPIKVSTRADEAGSSIVFKDYLARGNPAWEGYKQKKLNTTWPLTLPVDCRGIGESGMRSCVGTAGRIAYAPYRVVSNRGIPMAQIEYAANQFIGPAATASASTPDNCAATASDSRTLSTTSADWTKFSMTGSTAGYPLCNYSYMLVFKRLNGAYGGGVTFGQQRITFDYLSSIMQESTLDGVTPYGLVPLPANIRTIIRAGINGISSF